jgi:hypothetical protein
MWIALVSLGCGTTGGSEVRLPLMAGAASEARSFEDEGWTVTIEEARIALGPMYFCPTTSADLENCPAALAELRGAVAVDALDPSAPMLGELAALTGTLRSGMWDLGRPFLLGAAEPAPIAGAIDGALDGHSARFVARAERGDETFRVRADVDVSGMVSGIAAVRGVRTTHEIVGPDDGLTVRFDAPQILSRLDWEALSIEAGGGELVLTEGSTGYSALVQALTATALPALTWARPD